MSKHSSFPSFTSNQFPSFGNISDPIFVDCRSISSTTEAWELSSLAHKVTSIHEHLKSQLVLCYQYIGGYSYTQQVK